MTNTDGELSLRPRRTMPVPLGSIVRDFGLALSEGADRDTPLTGATLDSRDVRPGDLYLALPGARRHGADFAAGAAGLGAAAILTDEAGAERARATGLPVAIAPEDPRRIAGRVAAAVYGTERPGALVFGVTGTNGKTSVVYLLAALLEAAGLKTGISSTAERRVGETALISSLTSPEAPELHALLALMREEEVGGIALEVSAHAVARHRIDGVRFDVVAFNNFSQDHLDDFGDMESYFAAKLALFAPEHAERGVVVVDSAEGRRIARDSRIPVTTLSTEYGAEADWHLAVTAQDLDGVSFALQGPEGARFRGRVPVLGRFMAENAALALIMLHEAGIGLDRVAAGLDRGLIPVYIPGRLELIRAAPAASPVGSEAGDDAAHGGGSIAGPRFYVDYGHTPGAFQAMVDALAEVAEGRVIFLFGADGDRDTTKRFEMGRIAGAGSDAVIVCDYHPRTEDPAAIRAELIAGARAAGRAEVHEEADPRRAVRLAISLAGPDDVILYAGPGHEDYQEVAGHQLPYSARDEVRGALREAGML